MKYHLIYLLFLTHFLCFSSPRITVKKEFENVILVANIGRDSSDRDMLIFDHKDIENKKVFLKMENLKIGITLGLKDNKESIWTNGIKQNVLMLIHLLKNSEKN